MSNTEMLTSQLGECAERQDFEGALKLVRENQAEFARVLQPAGVRDALKKTTKDRLLLSFLDGVEFDSLPLDKSLVRLEKLMSFRKGSLVLCDAWGIGTVRDADYFYRRITVDFKSKRGHQFTYAAACDMLESAPEGHILVFRACDPEAFEKKLKEQPGEFIKDVLRSYGDMTAVRLEDVCVKNGFVKSVNWKSFWDNARRELHADKLVEIPVKRADPIRLKASVEDYGDGWMTAFSHETDPKRILAAVREYVAKGKFKTADDDSKAKISDRLAFAVTAARKVDDALYVQLACLVASLGFTNPSAAEMRGYLWERKRYVAAAAALPARDVGAMIAFLADGEEAKARLYSMIPEFPYTVVCELINRYGAEPACRKAVGDFMKDTQAPATLTPLIVGKIEKFGTFEYADVPVDGKPIRVLKSYSLWPELPSLITILCHAVALGEGRRSGETLKMQNLVRRLFEKTSWLEFVLKLLSPVDQVLFFERFQAAVAWDPATHHATVVRMMRIVPELESHFVKVEKKRELPRETSYRSYGLRKAEYLKLINEDMPANVKRIEFAKSYGDLSENAEYQYAKDEQRALMQKQSTMQADLEAVKPSEFADATTDAVMPGVTVVVATKDGERTWTVLGEWDNDVELGIMSSKARVAQNMMGRKVGDNFEMPDAEGNLAFATIKEIRPISDDIRAWMKLPPGIEI